MVRSSKANNHLVINLQSAFNAIGKTSCTNDLYVARRLLSKLVVSKSTQKHHLLSHTSHILKFNRKIVKKYYVIRENIQTPCGNIVGLSSVGFLIKI